MSAAAEPLAAIAAYLRAQNPILEATEGRIFRPDVPEAEVEHMPRAAVLVRSAGGGTMFGQNNLQVTDSRMDIYSYGSTRLEAERLAREVARALKNMTQNKKEGVKLYWARISSNPLPGVDPQTTWPFSLVTVQVMHSLSTI